MRKINLSIIVLDGNKKNKNKIFLFLKTLDNDIIIKFMLKF